MKVRLLYLGNQLSKHGLNTTTIETLGPDLESLGFEVVYASSKKGFVFRLLDMMGAIQTAMIEAALSGLTASAA